MNNTNERPVEAAPDLSSQATAPTLPQWPLIERRKADRRGTDRRRTARSADPLANDAAGCTCREREIVRLVLRGLTNKQIAQTLGIAEDTVKKHLHRAYKKLGVRRRALLIAERITAIAPNRSSSTSVE